MTTPLFGAAALNEQLVGVPGSRARLETPAAVLDLDLFEHNVALMAQTCRKAGLNLRPHAKSHKCAEITRRQMAAGALGNCCAKPGELLALFEGGVRDLLLSAPIASPVKIDALARAAAAGGRIGVVVDRADLAAAYADSAQRHGRVFDVLVDLDVGLKRSGVATPAEAVELARLVSGLDGLRYCGVQAYQGRVQHIDDFAARRAANQEMGRLLASMIEALRQAGFAPEIVSGGGTGSHLLDGEDRLLTEIQAGSYVFMDEAYGSVDMHGRGGPEFKPALRIAVTVIGHSSLGFAITDGGSKSFALDGPPPRVFLGGELVGRIEWCGDEFGRILPSDGQAALPIGTVVECTVPHCDPTINLHDILHVVRGADLVAQWPVEARGRAD
ncbi:D-serine deaminase, pyridoxal phosphate-dependent [Bosea sp. CRIB-10]|uniref:DSD1 family PLP-dependent enzyme n=1 Tax=Bosea sp. CRIB-10 TaxID=378404 RepID=UPI0008E07C28|nr:DSD1 family PLP-dependent enzyme [Bosea sp. CRIB-10]SFC46398.1 D-serine deaminase, pyridoxal phosphate-dependent [Bosea sp. CRIB-10]